MISVNSEQYESIQGQLHDTRLINSEQRVKLTKMHRDQLKLQQKIHQQSEFQKQFASDYLKQKNQD